jgi:hypothetical protein
MTPPENNTYLQVIYRAEEAPAKNTMTVVYRNPNIINNL